MEGVVTAMIPAGRVPSVTAIVLEPVSGGVGLTAILTAVPGPALVVQERVIVDGVADSAPNAAGAVIRAAARNDIRAPALWDKYRTAVLQRRPEEKFMGNPCSVSFITISPPRAL